VVCLEAAQVVEPLDPSDRRARSDNVGHDVAVQNRSGSPVHLSTRILLVVLAAATIAVGGWVLVTVNEPLTGAVLAVAWTVAVLVVMRLLFAVGFGVNRFNARRNADRAAAPARTREAHLAELADLHDRHLISDDEYEKERGRTLERS
jgi:hypothetical protein